MNWFSVRANDELEHTFAAMFPDSKIASLDGMAKTKTMDVLNHELAPYFKSLLLDSFNVSNIFVYSFDESLNDITQTCEMDLYIRYWDVIDNEVNVRYWGSTFLDILMT